MKTLELGLITRPHGVRGELKLKLHFEQSTTLFEVSSVRLELPSGDQRKCCVAGVRRASKGVLLRLDGVETLEAAEELRGARLLVDRDELTPLEPDEYYLADLPGCAVQGPSGRIGVVEEVHSHPTVDAVSIRTPDGRLLQQPLTDSWVERVSVAEGILVLSSEDGLIA